MDRCKRGKSKELYNETHCDSYAWKSIACDVSLLMPPKEGENIAFFKTERRWRGADKVPYERIIYMLGFDTVNACTQRCPVLHSSINRGPMNSKLCRGGDYFPLLMHVND